MAGVAFGLLVLTKAAYLYVFLGLVVTLPAFRVLTDPTGWRAILGEMGVLSAAFAVVVIPWMYRNHHHFGEFQISERGGLILYTRAVKNSMTFEEYRASFYFWARPSLRAPLRRVLGVASDDFLIGGPYQRLNRTGRSGFREEDVLAERSGRPEDAISFYSVARAERVRLMNQFERTGSANALTEADATLQEQALRMIRDHPAKHLAMTVPFVWRGALIPFPVLLIGLAYSVWTRRTYLVAYVLPAFGAVTFHGLLTHYIPRYSVPMVPVCIVVIAGAAWWVVRWGVRRIRPNLAAASPSPVREGEPQ
jgi:hypothetical protein